MNPRVLLEALLARRGLFALVLLTTVAATIGVSLWLPKIYRATASVLIAEPTPGTGFIAPQERQAYMQTQEGIVSSDRVVRRVLQAAAAAGTPTDLQLADLAVDTTQSNIIRIRYDAPDPARAAALANAFARGYVEAIAELRAQDDSRSQLLLDDKLAVLRSTLQQAQAELTEFQVEHGMPASDERGDVEQMQLAELSAQLAKAREQALERANRRRQTHDLVRAGAPLERLPEVLGDAQVQRLGLDLAQGEVKLNEIAQHYGTAYPAYQRQASENRSRRAAIDEQVRRIVAAIDVAADHAQRQVAGLEAAVAAQRQTLLQQMARRNELSRRMQNVQTARRTYDAAEAQFVVGVAGRRAALPQVSVLGEAAPPSQPQRPKLLLNVVASLLLGAALGLAVVIALEMADRRVRAPSDLRLASAVPLLGVVSPWLPQPQALSAGARPGLPHERRGERR